MSAFDFTQILKSRTLRGLTQTELARRSMTSLATIQNLEAGKANPELGTLEKILAVLGMSLKIQNLPLDWDRLVSLGVPLLVPTRRPIRPDRNALSNELIRLRSEDWGKTLSNRERASLVAWLSALENHFPVFWRQTANHLDAWLRKQKIGGSEIKLRRLALATLAEYL